MDGGVRAQRPPDVFHPRCRASSPRLLRAGRLLFYGCQTSIMVPVTRCAPPRVIHFWWGDPYVRRVWDTSSKTYLSTVSLLSRRNWRRHSGPYMRVWVRHSSRRLCTRPSNILYVRAWCCWRASSAGKAFARMLYFYGGPADQYYGACHSLCTTV